MTKNFIFLAITSLLITSCGSDSPSDEVQNPPTPTPTPGPTPDPDPQSSNYAELYRPQVHYTPAKNWVNDPNGMVYVNGTWNLYYQYNPYGNGWGNMSWGHATSKDLVHWKEEQTVLYRDELGDIFSGSAVIDKDNNAGFGAGSVIAFFTSAGKTQQQSMAYSTDGGMSFKTYQNNPVIGNPDRPDFRDPKVFWHEESQNWVMSLALGWSYGIEFWTSKDLKNWYKSGSFTTDISRCNKGQWECPDLIQLDYKGEKKWVLIVSVNPGGPISGSGTMYFVGNFDGKTFTADPLDYPLWADYGMDNYAGVTWSNAPDNRRVFLGWMNNWNYSGDVPCSPWRSAFTLPRDLSLIEYQGSPLLASKVSPEVKKLEGEWKSLSTNANETSTIDGDTNLSSSTALCSYHLQVTMSLATKNTITLSNGKNEKLEIAYSTIGKRLTIDRSSKTGVASFSTFAMTNIAGPLRSEGENVTLDIYVDQSSVEIFTANGSFAMTNLVYPTTIYNQVTVSSAVSEMRYTPLRSIWR